MDDQKWQRDQKSTPPSVNYSAYGRDYDRVEGKLQKQSKEAAVDPNSIDPTSLVINTSSNTNIINKFSIGEQKAEQRWVHCTHKKQDCRDHYADRESNQQ